MRLHPAIRKWNIVVSSYDYNASRTSLQTIIILNAKAEKQHKEQLKQLEDFEMPQLTLLLNSVFTNVDQLSFPLQIVNRIKNSFQNTS